MKNDYEYIEIEEKHETIYKEGVIMFLILAMITTFMVYLHSKSEILEVVPESIWAIFIGMALGFYIDINKSKDEYLSKEVEFEPQAFFLVLLPPIMFQAGFSLSVSTFLRNILTINAFAVGATIIASFTFSIILYYGMQWTSYNFTYLDTLHFGCFISAIDPVATISIFQSLKVNDQIYLILFGEGTLNDAVAIALSSSVESVQNTIKEGISPNYTQITMHSIGYFFVFFFASLLIGIVISVLMSYMFVKFDFDLIPWLEIGCFLQSSYLPYIVAEYMNLSGILAILATGIIMRNYAYYSLSPCGKVTIDNLVETIGYI